MLRLRILAGWAIGCALFAVACAIPLYRQWRRHRRATAFLRALDAANRQTYATLTNRNLK